MAFGIGSKVVIEGDILLEDDHQVFDGCSRLDNIASDLRGTWRVAASAELARGPKVIDAIKAVARICRIALSVREVRGNPSYVATLTILLRRDVGVKRLSITVG